MAWEYQLKHPKGYKRKAHHAPRKMWRNDGSHYQELQRANEEFTERMRGRKFEDTVFKTRHLYTANLKKTV